MGALDGVSAGDLSAAINLAATSADLINRIGGKVEDISALLATLDANQAKASESRWVGIVDDIVNRRAALAIATIQSPVIQTALATPEAMAALIAGLAASGALTAAGYTLVAAGFTKA